MPRSVKTSRIIAEATITPTDIPSADGDMVTVAFTVPTRGYIHRLHANWGKSSAFANSGDDGGFYLHTACAAGAGAGTTRLVSADAQTIFASGPLSPKNGYDYGGAKEIGSSIYVFAPALDINGGMKGGGEASVPQGGGPVGAFYDLSGGTLGPATGTGTIFFTWVGGKDMNDDALFFKLRLEIEPLS